MRIEYERACVEAGMPEEKIKELRRMFDAEYKKLKREKEAKTDVEYGIYSLELLQSPDKGAGYFDIPDPDMDVEKRILHKIDMERLREVLNMISPEQREFILDCFDAEWGARKKIAEKYNMSTGAVKKRKWKIMKKL